MSAPCDCCGAMTWTPLFTESGLHLDQCASCDLLSVREVPADAERMTEMEEGHYAGTLAVLDAQRQLRMEEGSAPRFSRYLDLARRHVPTGRWLDLGCGAGLLPRLAAAAGYDAEGLELNADRRALAEASGLTVHARPLEDAGIADDSFDVVSMVNVFSHLVRPSQTLAEIGRVLRPGGVLLMVTGEMTTGVRQRDQHNWNLGDHLHFLGDRTIASYADRLGFSVLEHDRRWLPEEMYTREWLRAPGRDPRKNALKRAMAAAPGGLALVRAVMLRRHADSKAHASVFVLRFD